MSVIKPRVTLSTGAFRLVDIGHGAFVIESRDKDALGNERWTAIMHSRENLDDGSICDRALTELLLKGVRP